MTTVKEDLQRRFDEAASASGLDSALSNDLFDQLAAAYSEPQRHYHTLTHLQHMFAKQDEAGLADPACYWATWFHDAIYIPGKGNNEAQSAEMASDRLANLGLPETLIKRTAELIRLTEHHDCAAQDRIAHLFLDSDMSILGEEQAAYVGYVKSIRLEFSKVPAFLFNRGRKAFLKDLLNRENIFLSNHFRNAYEAAARRNLSQELESLS